RRSLTGTALRRRRTGRARRARRARSGVGAVGVAAVTAVGITAGVVPVAAVGAVAVVAAGPVGAVVVGDVTRPLVPPRGGDVVVGQAGDRVRHLLLLGNGRARGRDASQRRVGQTGDDAVSATSSYERRRSTGSWVRVVTISSSAPVAATRSARP